MSEKYFTIKLAGTHIEIRPRGEHMKMFCRDYIDEGVPAFTVEVGEQNIEDERERAIEYFGYAETSDKELERLWIYRKIAEKLPYYGAFLIHASAVMVDGKAYLFSGPSGAGKTTQTRLWKAEFRDRMKVINDDKPLIKVTDDEVLACGSPWSGKEKWNNNISAPLCGIICVNQAEENGIELLPGTAAWEAVMNQVYRSRDPKTMKKILDFVDRMIETTPIYRLECNREREAVTVAFAAVSGKS